MGAYQLGKGSIPRPLISVCAIVIAIGLAAPAHAGMPGMITKLSTAVASTSQTAPAISGTSVVWTQGEALSSGATNFDIFFLDLGTMPSRNLTNTPGEQEFLEDVDGTNVVFTHTSPSSSGDIVIYDTISNTGTPIAVGSSAVRYEQPAIRGRYVVYVKSGARTDIAGYDNALGVPMMQLTDDAAVQAHPRVSGDYVVFEDYGSGNADVYGYRVSTAGPAFPIATGLSAQSMPDIDGDWVVWVETAGGTDQVMAYNLATLATTALTTVASNKLQPRVSGSRVVWADDRNGNWDIYSYDFASAREEAMIDGAYDQMLSDIDGNRVVYTSNEGGFEEIYLFTPSALPPPVELPFGCDPGKTDAYDAPVTMVRTTRRPVFATRAFTPVTGKSLYVCVENGKADGSERTTELLFGADDRMLLNPADFKPNDNPPRWVAAEVFDSKKAKSHLWTAVLFGSKMPSTVTITLRVAK
jgi:TolB protein